MITDKTKILTDKGFLSSTQIDELRGVKSLCPSTGTWQAVWIEKKALEYVWSYSLVPFYNSGTSRSWNFEATRPSLVPLIDGGSTYDLRLKDGLVANAADAGYDEIAWIRGLMYRDGIRYVSSVDPKRYEKKHRGRIETILAGCDYLDTEGRLPDSADSIAAKGSFIRGYLAAEPVHALGKLSTADAQFFRFFLDNHGYAGLVLTGNDGKVRRHIKTKKTTEFYDQFFVYYVKGIALKGFKVFNISNKPEEKHEVFSIGTQNNTGYICEGGWILF